MGQSLDANFGSWLKNAEMKQSVIDVFHLVFILGLKALLGSLKNVKWFYLNDFCGISNKLLFLLMFLFCIVCDRTDGYKGNHSVSQICTHILHYQVKYQTNLVKNINTKALSGVIKINYLYKFPTEKQCDIKLLTGIIFKNQSI